MNAREKSKRFAALLILVLFAFAFSLRRFRIYRIHGGSMLPGFRDGEMFIVHTRGVQARRGDVVIVIDPREPANQYMKRVIGLPEDKVTLSDGQLVLNDSVIAEPYLGGLPSSVGLAQQSWKLGTQELFVMGDNRAHSTDSREFGSVKSSAVVGRVWLRWWPVKRFGLIKSG